MWYNKKIEEYANINYKINQLYCNKYNYTLIKSDEVLCKNRKPHWERISLILKYFNDFDYLVWIDADAYFYLDNQPLENVIKEHLDKLFIFSGDTDKLTASSCCINSGFFIVKQCTESKNILERWLYDNDLFENKELKTENKYGRGNWNDQAVLRYMYDNNILNLKTNSIIIDYGILQHFKKSHKIPKNNYDLTINPYIFHSAGGENMKIINRINNSKEYYLKNVMGQYSKYINSNIQLSKNVIDDIMLTIKNTSKMLVFGLGYDSELWYNLTNKNTYFIENNKTYIDLNSNINKNNIIYYTYENIKVKTSFKLTNEQLDSYKIPSQILDNAPYDIILIDGPNGFNDDCPGRLLPIFWSKKYLSKVGTIIYVDDASRKLEKYSINKYFIGNQKYYIKDRLGTMKIIV